MPHKKINVYTTQLAELNSNFSILGIVIGVKVNSHTQTSLSLQWERPDYFQGSITGFIQYTALPDGDTMWLYVMESDDIVRLSGLEEMTYYTIQTAIVDRNRKICVYSAPIIASTVAGLALA